MSAMERLSARVRESLPELSESRRAEQRARFVTAVAQKYRAPGGLRGWMVATLGVLAVVMGVFGARAWRRQHEAAVVVSSSTERWWSRVEQQTSERVGDRGELTLEPSSAAHLLQVGERVDVVLEHGAVVSSVVPKRGTHWGVRAGAYWVQAVGTRFSVEYEPASELLLVRVDEGSVQVSGGQLGVSNVHLQVGQVLSVVGSRVSIARGEQAEGPTTERPESPVSDPDDGSPTSHPQGPARAASPSVRPPAGAAVEPEPTWLELQGRGEYQKALDAAKRLGFEQLVSTLPCAELSELADAARLARDAARAQSALLQLRNRCGSSPAGRRSAFLLGRLSDGPNPAQAAGWYETYLSEAPGDRFAEQALGRLISAQQRAGRLDKAQLAASRYLRSYPGGGYAELARTLAQP